MSRRYEEFRAQLNGYLQNAYNTSNQTQLYKEVRHAKLRSELTKIDNDNRKNKETLDKNFARNKETMVKAEETRLRKTFVPNKLDLKHPFRFMTAQGREEAIKEKARANVTEHKQKATAALNRDKKSKVNRIVKLARKSNEMRASFWSSSDKWYGRKMQKSTTGQNSTQARSKPKRSR